jgi:hypothetical protein
VKSELAIDNEGRSTRCHTGLTCDLIWLNEDAKEAYNLARAGFKHPSGRLNTRSPRRGEQQPVPDQVQVICESPKVGSAKGDNPFAIITFDGA